jgi:hypothetical protein
MIKFKKEDIIRFKGTKQDGCWEKYFGSFGIKKGDKAFICGVETWDAKEPHYFVSSPKKGNDTRGYLTDDDLELCNSQTMKELLE